MVLTGAGDVAFCAGADLKAIDTLRRAPDDAEAGRSASRGSPRRSRRSPRSRAGAWPAGWSSRCGATCGSPTEGSTLGFPERRWGVPLIDGGTQRLPRIVGMGRALDLILTGRMVVDRRGAGDRDGHRGRARAGRHLERALEIAEGLAAFPQETMLADRRARDRWLRAPAGRGAGARGEGRPGRVRRRHRRRVAIRGRGGTRRRGRRSTGSDEHDLLRHRRHRLHRPPPRRAAARSARATSTCSCARARTEQARRR